MAKSDLVTKRICPTTGKKFYDLNKSPVISPYTGEVVPIAPVAPPIKTRIVRLAHAQVDKRSRSAAASLSPPPPRFQNIFGTVCPPKAFPPDLVADHRPYFLD